MCPLSTEGIPHHLVFKTVSIFTLFDFQWGGHIYRETVLCTPRGKFFWSYKKKTFFSRAKLKYAIMYFRTCIWRQNIFHTCINEHSNSLIQLASVSKKKKTAEPEIRIQIVSTFIHLFVHCRSSTKYFKRLPGTHKLPTAQLVFLVVGWLIWNS